MAELKMSQEFQLAVMILLAFLVGLIVIGVDPDYRVEKNVISNARYYVESGFQDQSDAPETDDNASSVNF